MPAGRLHERLDDEARDSPRARRTAARARQASLARTPPPSRGSRTHAETSSARSQEERAELRVEEVDPTEAHGADRVAVVAVVA